MTKTTMVKKPSAKTAVTSAVKRKQSDNQDDHQNRVTQSDNKKTKVKDGGVPLKRSGSKANIQTDAVMIPEEVVQEKESTCRIPDILDQPSSCETEKPSPDESDEENKDEEMGEEEDDSSMPLPDKSSIRSVRIGDRYGTQVYSYWNLPPYKKGQFSKTKGQITNTSHSGYTVEILAEHCQDDDEDRERLADHIHTILYRHLQNEGKSLSILKDCTIDVSRCTSSESHIITILWPRVRNGPSLSKLTLKIKDTCYFFKLMKPCLDVTFRTINVEMSSDKDITKLLDLFEKAIEKRASIVDVWRWDKYNETSQSNEWTGMLRILISLNMKYWPPKEFPKKNSSIDIRLGALPAYIYYDEEAIELQYMGRGAWCTKCKPSVDKFHTTLYCPVFNFTM